MEKKKFEPNSWVKFEIEGITIIGRTLESVKGEKFVAIVDALGITGLMPWKYVENNSKNLSKLAFLRTKEEEDFFEKHGKPDIKYDKNQHLSEEENQINVEIKSYLMFGNKPAEA